MTEVATANSIIEMLSDYLPRMHSEKPFYGLMSLVSHDGIVKFIEMPMLVCRPHAPQAGPMRHMAGPRMSHMLIGEM